MRISDWSSDVCSSDLIGNVGSNAEDAESDRVHIAGLVVREVPRLHSNFRSTQDFREYLKANKTVAIADIDTRRLTRILRDKGSQNGCIVAGSRISEKKALEARSEEHTSELQSLMRNPYAVFCLKKKKKKEGNT